MTIIELIDAAALTALRDFIREGGYRSRFRSSGSPEFFRFADPTDEHFPKELEFFSRTPSNYDLAPGEVVPISMEPDHHGLSAILLNDAYYDLIRTHQDTRDGLGISNATALIPLKAFAWLDLSRLKAEGQKIDSKKIVKHRSDVFRLAATLPAEPGPVLPDEILKDLRRFMQAFPADSPSPHKPSADALPVIIAPHDLGLDDPDPRFAIIGSGSRKKSAHQLAQEFLNASPDSLWAIVTNGRTLRLLRDADTLTRPNFLEFDLETILRDDQHRYADFSALWRILHASRALGSSDWQGLRRFRRLAAVVKDSFRVRCAKPQLTSISC